MVPTRLVEAFSSVRDPRVERTKLHRLTDILVIAILAVINGATAWSDMQAFAETRLAWLRGFLALPHGVPSEDTFRRVFEAISPREFGRAVTEIIEDLVTELDGKVVALDGKTLRGSFDRRRGKSALHVVSAWVTDLGLSLGQIAVDDKGLPVRSGSHVPVRVEVRAAANEGGGVGAASCGIGLPSAHTSAPRDVAVWPSSSCFGEAMSLRPPAKRECRRTSVAGRGRAGGGVSRGIS